MDGQLESVIRRVATTDPVWGFWTAEGPEKVNVVCGWCGFRLDQLTRPSAPSPWSKASNRRPAAKGNDASSVRLGTPSTRPGTVKISCGGRRCKAEHLIGIPSLATRVQRAIAVGSRTVVWGEGPYQRRRG